MAARLEPLGGGVARGVVVAGDDDSGETGGRDECGERGGAECGGNGKGRASGAQRERGLEPLGDGERGRCPREVSSARRSAAGLGPRCGYR